MLGMDGHAGSTVNDGGFGVPGCWAVAIPQAESAVVVATARAGSRRRAVGIMVRHCNAEAFVGHVLLLHITPANM